MFFIVSHVKAINWDLILEESIEHNRFSQLISDALCFGARRPKRRSYFVLTKSATTKINLGFAPKRAAGDLATPSDLGKTGRTDRTRRRRLARNGRTIRKYFG